MRGYSIDSLLGHAWILFAERDVGFTEEAGQNIANVLCEVKRVFEDIFGRDVVNAHERLVVAHAKDDFHMTFRDSGIIFLNSCGTFYQQHIYQFAHELCHYMVDGEVCEPYRWFEETLCALMSFHVLRRVKTREMKAPTFELGGMYHGIDGYIQGEYITIDIKNEPFQQFFWRNLPYLKDNCYDRHMNNTIAKQLDALFTEQPQLWHIVRKLHLIQPNMELAEALVTVTDAADIPRPLCGRLLSIF